MSHPPININSASAEQLKRLPNVGAKRAENIIRSRDQETGHISLADLYTATTIVAEEWLKWRQEGKVLLELSEEELEQYPPTQLPSASESMRDLISLMRQEADERRREADERRRMDQERMEREFQLQEIRVQRERGRKGSVNSPCSWSNSRA